MLFDVTKIITYPLSLSCENGSFTANKKALTKVPTRDSIMAYQDIVGHIDFDDVNKRTEQSSWH